MTTSARSRRDAVRRQLARLAAPVDLYGEAVLPEGFAACGGAPKVDATSRVLLTGATGFLGAHLLADLLDGARAPGEVLCLVRCADRRDGERRVREALLRQRRWRDEHAGRLVVVPGDLGREGLGLDAETRAWLAREVDVVVHNGAAVNLLFPYAMLKAVNVGATRALLQLATHGRPKAFHYVSTATVRFGERVVVREDDPLAAPPTHGGYVQSKWVAEQLVRVARARGVAAAIHRPAIIGWSCETGIANLGDGAAQGGDFVCGMLRAALRTGVAPELDMALNVVPVDCVSRTIAEAVRDPTATDHDYHVVHERCSTWLQLLQHCDALGHPIRRLPYADWHGLMDGAAGPYEAFLALLPEADGSGHDASLAGLLAPARMPTMERTNVQRLLDRAGLSYPDVDAALLRRCLAHLIAR